MLGHFLFTLGGNIYVVGGPQSADSKSWLGKTNISEPKLVLDNFQDLMVVQGKSSIRSCQHSGGIREEPVFIGGV